MSEEAREGAGSEEPVEVTDEVMAGLVSKLRTLDLNETEAAVLGSVFLAASGSAGSEVAGFGVVYEIEVTDHTSRGFKGSDEELQAVLRSGVGSYVFPSRSVILGRG